MDLKQRELLIYGYIREIERDTTLSYEIPDAVKNIIASKYPLAFKWKPGGDLIISEDGLTITSKKKQFRTMQFGEFLHHKDKIIFRVLFDLAKATANCIGIGAITPEYVHPEVQTNYNHGDNHTMWIDGSGWFITTKSDFKTKCNTDNGETNNDYSGFFFKGDKVYIEANMITQRIRIWNEKEDENKVFEVECPESVAVIVDMCPNQTVSVIEQVFTYK